MTLLVLPDSSLMSLASTLDPLRAANRIGGRVVYRYRLVSADGSDPATSCGVRLRVDGAFEPDRQTDILIVLAAFRVYEHCDARLMRLIGRGARNAHFVGGVEAGPFVLALAGLLDGRTATTHWEDLEEFATRFPEIDVRADRWVIDGRFFTTGAAAPALDFLLSLIAARQGHGTALDVASVYVYDGMRTGSEGQPSVSLGQLRWREPRLAEAIGIMERHVETPLTVAAIARRVSVSTRTLEALFSRRTRQSPGAFYLGLRLKAARRLVLDSDVPMAEIALRCGFSSSAALSRSFKRQFGISPSGARRAS